MKTVREREEEVAACAAALLYLRRHTAAPLHTCTAAAAPVLCITVGSADTVFLASFTVFLWFFVLPCH